MSLDRHYGDQNAAVASVVARLRHLNLNGPAAEEATKRAKPCPLCAEQGRTKRIHIYRRFFAKWPTPDHIDWPSFMITSCPTFIAIKPADREDAVLRLDACTRCGAYLHNQDGCRRTPPKCSEPAPGGGTCGEGHITALHGGSPAVQAMGVSLASPSLVATALAQPPCTFTSTPVLLALKMVRAAENNEEALLLGDQGSQVSLIRHVAAKRLGCGPGQPYVLHLQVVGDSYRPIRTKLYTVRLIDSRGK